MRILKFGGTSVGKPERMRAVARLVIQDNAEQKVVVLSALSGVTNQLVAIGQDLVIGQKQEAKVKIEAVYQQHRVFAESLYQKPASLEKAGKLILKAQAQMEAAVLGASFGQKEEKLLLAEGELLSTQLFQLYMEETGENSALIPALEFMRIDQENEPMLDYISEHIQAYVSPSHKEKSIFVTQGYICRNTKGEVDNLKRGGSDYTASLIGAALRADEIQIWTDIDGMHNNDPRYVKNTFPVAELSFDEAAELAYFGAKILHPATIHPAQKYNIPVRLLNTMQPEAKGTIIQSTLNTEPAIKAIAAKDGITAIKIKSGRMLLAYGFLRKVFEVFEKYKTPIDMITTSEVAVSLTIDDTKHLSEVMEELQQFGSVEVDTDQTIVCIAGNFVAERKGASLKVFESLRNIPVRMISFGGSRHNISLLIPTSYKQEALVALNEGVFESALQVR